MGILGNVLAILNVVAAIGFLFLAALDYGARQGWSFLVLQQQFMMRGLPVDEAQTDPDGRPLVTLVGDRMQKALFAGASPPVRTQQDAVRKRHDDLINRVRAAGNPQAQRNDLAEALVPLAHTEGEREALRAKVEDPKFSVDDLLGPDGPLERYFRDALQGKTATGQALDTDQRRQAIAHVLFNTGDDFQWTLAVVGAASYAREADGQATALSAMVPTLQGLMTRERADFELNHRALIGRIVELHNRLRNLQGTLTKQREVRERHVNLVKARQAEIDALNQEIEATRQATRTALARQSELEQALWNAERTVQTTQQKNLDLERQIREREHVR